MPNKDYQNLSTQGSGSITKITPFQIKSNDNFGSLAIDLEAFRGQLAAVIGDGYKTDLTTTTGSSVNYISNVSLKTLANQIDASTGSLFRIINNMTVSGSTILGDSSSDVVTVNSQITGSLFSIGGGTINSTTIGASGQASGKFTTLSASSDLSIQGNAAVQGTLGVTGISTLGTVNAGTITFTSASITGGAGIVGNLSVTGSLIADNLSIGGGYGSSGVTVSNAGNIQANGTLTIDGASTLTGNATLGGDIVSAAPGGKNIFIGAGANPITIGGATSTVSIPGTGSIGVLTVNNNLTVTGDLTVNGTTTTINSTTVTVDDKNIILGAVAGATDAGADGGGITLSGSTDHTIIWRDATDAWEFSEHLVSNGNGTKDLGLSANRWRFLYAGTGSFSNGTNTLTARHDAIFGSNVLTVSASAGDVILDDKWRGATTTFGSTAGIKVSSAGSDWTSFNTNFSTQNSILGALNQVASNSSNPRKLTYNISASYASGTSVPVNLGSFSDSVTFDATAITGRSSLVFYNGQLLGSGSTANVQSNPATADYSVDGGLSNFRFGFPVSSGDVVVVKID